MRTIKEKIASQFVDIVLQPLEEAQSEKLVLNLLRIKGLAVSIRDLIIKKTGGNPFFIEQVVRGFVDEGAVIMGKEGFTVTDRIEDCVDPEQHSGSDYDTN